MKRLAFLLAALPALPAVAQEKAPPPVRENPTLTTLSIFAGGPGGLWRSPDWGHSWKKVEKKGEAGVAPETMGAVHAILPIGSSVYVAGSGGVFVSQDFGEIWARWPVEASVLSILPSRYPLADLTVFIGTTQGLLVSEDAGRSFKPTRLWGVEVKRIEWPGPALVVGTSRGVMISKDMGATWEPPGEGLGSGPVESLALSSFYPADPVLFAGIGQKGVYRSRDGGRTWQVVGLQGSRVVDLVWLGPFLYALTEGALFRSQDTGDTWTQIGRGLEGAHQRILFPLAPASGAEVFAATDRGIWRSGDGAESFQQLSSIEETVSVLATFPQPDMLKPKPKKR